MIQETLTEYDIQSKNGKWKNHYNLILNNYSIHKSKFTKNPNNTIKYQLNTFTTIKPYKTSLIVY